MEHVEKERLALLHSFFFWSKKGMLFSTSIAVKRRQSGLKPVYFLYMVKKYKYRGVEWINLESPSPTDIQEIASTYSIHQLVSQELAKESVRSRVDLHDEYLYFIFHFPLHNALPGARDTREVDFIVGKNFLITTHYAPFPPIEELGGILENSEPFTGRHKALNAGHLFFFVARHLYEALFPMLEEMAIELEKIEAGIFQGREKEMVMRLSTASQKLIDFKKAVRSHRELLRSLEETGPLLFGSDFGFYARALTGEYEKVASLVTTNQEVLHELRLTNDSLLSTKTNEVIKTLTIMAFVTFPLTLVAGIFGMNTKNTPLVGLENGFWLIITLMVLATLSMFSFFKYKKWL